MTEQENYDESIAQHSKGLKEWNDTNSFIDSKNMNHIEHYDINNSISKSIDFAKEYAQLAIKYLFLLNGGALLSMPAFLGAFEEISKKSIFGPSFIFIIGLVSIVLCTLFSYFASVAAALLGHSDKHHNLYVLRKIYYINKSEDYASELDDDIEKEDKNIRKYRRRSNLFERTAIILGILSLLCFVFGTILLSCNLANI